MIEKTRSNHHVAKFLRCLNTVMAVVLCVLAIYHYTQPNAAWRSGTIEIVAATCLLIAAYLASSRIAVVINTFFAVAIAALGIRHIAIGGGYVSGVIELLFSVFLIYSAVMITKLRKNK